jgi:hypothetical protein
VDDRMENYDATEPQQEQEGWYGDYTRERDRSGNAPKKRKWLARAKAKAARKARKVTRHG